MVTRQTGTEGLHLSIYGPQRVEGLTQRGPIDGTPVTFINLVSCCSSGYVLLLLFLFIYLFYFTYLFYFIYLLYSIVSNDLYCCHVLRTGP